MPPKEIDPGERWAAVLGAKCVLSRAVEKITPPQARQAIEIEDKVSKLARSLCAGGLEPSFPMPPPYPWLLDATSAKFNEEQVRAMFGPIPDEHRMPYMTTAERQFDFLSVSLPRSVYSSAAGDENLPISDPEFFAFAVGYRVVDEPLAVFELMAGAALLRKQAKIVREIFPTLAGAIDIAIQLAITDARARGGKTWTLPHLAEFGIRDWLGLKVHTVPYQAAYVAGSKARDAQPQPSRAQHSAAADGSLSQTARALYGQVK